MKVVLQRVARVAVTAEGQQVGAINRGFLILLGVADGDTEAIADKMVDKICVYLKMKMERPICH